MTGTIDLTAIINAVIALCAALLTTRLIPWLSAKLKNEDVQTLEFWTDIAVRAAEQYFGSKSGQEKKAYVMSFLESRGFKIDDALIEATVGTLFGIKAGDGGNQKNAGRGEF
ncbi:MAG: phage holin, LLH family [Oscillospiraceae bacterium]